ncbi:unnamed protein product [Dovyalis caffra]|uniref:Uncharacterized protein n=1 Tax=Dovyalis caffra TaxID=77055 RepID=A0AAV1R1A4_9ROSI|nr:unnamed protein product [Dovyalis caffra]
MLIMLLLYSIQRSSLLLVMIITGAFHYAVVRKVRSQADIVNLHSEVYRDAAIRVSQGHIFSCHQMLRLSLSFHVWEVEDHSTPNWCLKHRLVLSRLWLWLTIEAFSAIDEDIAYLWYRKRVLSWNIKGRRLEVVLLNS